MGFAAQGRQAAYGARPKESQKLRATAACITEVASANAMAAEMAAVSVVREELAGRRARRAIDST